MRNLKDLTEDQLMRMHNDVLIEIGYNTSLIKEYEKLVDIDVENLFTIDQELKLRENQPKLNN